MYSSPAVLALFGVSMMIAAVGCASARPSGPDNRRVPEGTWGGEHVALSVAKAAAHVEFDCAYGDINQPIAIDESGKFAIDGVYVQEHAGPVRIGEEPARMPASYSGRVAGATMTLDVTLKESHERIGAYTLRFGAEPRVRKCR
jgi:hypothetical protein